MQLRRLVATTALAVAAATTLAACGGNDNPHNGTTEGVYVTTGDLKYQVQISRQLNPHDFEDRDYLSGMSGAASRLAPNQDWFGVFLRVFNKSNGAHPSAQQFFIKDTTGRRFDPVAVKNPVGYRALVVQPGDSIPVPGSQARENPTQGGLILFKIPVASFANRPLILHILPPQGGQEATVDLDV